MHILIDPSFFFTNEISAPNDEWFSLIKPLSNSSCNCFFNFYSLVGAIMYDALEIGVISKVSLILNSNFL